jgi:signal transduction histidine kinase
MLRDAAVAALAFGATLALLAGRHGSNPSLDALGVVLAALASLPLVLRRRSPLGVFAVTTAASASLNGLGYALGPPIGPTIALFFVASDERTRDRIRPTALIVLGLFALHVAVTPISHNGFPTSEILFGVIVWGGAWAVGDQVRERRRRLADLVERARRAERDTQRERRLAAAEERTRIARDLHDSAAHAINVILVQAGAARLLQERDPEAARGALATIEDVARETIGEIDQLVRALRDDDGDRLRPVELPTGLAALATLVERHRAAGLAVTLRVRGARRPLSPAVDQAAYRIVQEALTNATRHGLGSAEAVITYGGRALGLAVANPAGPDEHARDGHGILGMRERAVLLGGTLETRCGGGTFRVVARLPYGSAW